MNGRRTARRVYRSVEVDIDVGVHIPAKAERKLAGEIFLVLRKRGCLPRDLAWDMRFEGECVDAICEALANNDLEDFVNVRA